MENYRKITARLIFPIIVHFLEIYKKLNCLLGTIQTYCLQIPHNNNNSFKIWLIFKMI
jgi:hypothetical protein